MPEPASAARDADTRADALLGLAEEAEQGRFSPDHARLAAQLAEVADELPSAVASFLHGGRRESALRLVGVLSGFWQDAGRVDEGRSLTEWVLAETPAHSPSRCRALLAAAELAFRQGDQDAAVRRSEESVAAARSVGNRTVAALALTNLARVAFRADAADEIERLSNEALAAAPGDPVARRAALHMLAWAAHTAGNMELAVARFEESLDFRREIGDQLGEAVELGNLADLALERGDLSTADVLLQQSLALAREIGSQYLLLAQLVSAAVLAARRGDHELAVRLATSAQLGYERAGLIPDPGGLEQIEQLLASARTVLGRRFNAAQAAGERLSPQQAADALDGG